MFLAPVLSAQFTTAPTGRPTVTLKLAPTVAAVEMGGIWVKHNSNTHKNYDGDEGVRDTFLAHFSLMGIWDLARAKRVNTRSDSASRMGRSISKIQKLHCANYPLSFQKLQCEKF